MNIFNEGNKQDIAQVLNAKDYRVAVQKAIFNKYPDQTLVDINLNIPGPIKNNQYLKNIFDRGISELENSWQKSGYKYKLVKALNEDSGCEKFYVLSLPAIQVKRSTIDFEEHTPLGRLFDADVLVKDNNTAISRKDLGQNVRKCFLCSRRAKECARSRRHSVKEMQDFISNLYIKYIENA